MDDSFNANGVGANAKENHILADHCEPGIWAKLRPQAIEFGLPGDLSNTSPQKPHHTQCKAWAVECDEIRDFFKIGGHKQRHAEAH